MGWCRPWSSCHTYCGGCGWLVARQGSRVTWSPLNWYHMYQHHPQTTQVCVWLASVASVRAWITASVPARVDNANWCGEQLVWMGPANICAKFREASRRSTSPMTIPRTRPFSFCNATVRPSPRLGMMVAGTLACARRWATAVSR